MPRPYDSSDPHPIAVVLLFRTQAERESFVRRLEDAPLATLHWRHLTGNPEPIEAATVLAVEVHPDKWDRINPPPPPLTPALLAPTDPGGPKTAFALARDLLAGPDWPVRVAVQCCHLRDGTVATYDAANGTTGQLTLVRAVDEVLILGEDPDLFEHRDGEIADPIRAQAAAPTVDELRSLAGPAQRIAALEAEVAALCTTLDSVGAESSGDPLVLKIEALCQELGPLKYADTPVSTLQSALSDRRVAYNALGWREAGSHLRAEIKTLEAAIGQIRALADRDTPAQAAADTLLRSFDYVPDVFRRYFTSPFEQYADRVGQAFVVLGRDTDAEAELAEFEHMYKIRFEDGTVITAWGHEVCVLKSARAAAPAAVDTNAAKAAALVARLQAAQPGDFAATADALDDRVHDTKGDEAAAINNSGLEDQLVYLLDNGDTIADLERILQRAIAEADDEP